MCPLEFQFINFESVAVRKIVNIFCVSTRSQSKFICQFWSKTHKRTDTKIINILHAIYDPSPYLALTSSTHLNCFAVRRKLRCTYFTRLYESIQLFMWFFVQLIRRLISCPHFVSVPTPTPKPFLPILLFLCNAQAHVFASIS